MRADVVQVSSIGQSVLGNDVNIAPVKVRVRSRFAVGGKETVAKDHVGWRKSAWIRSAEQNGVASHLGVDQVPVGSFHRFLAQFWIVGQFPIGSDKRRRKHVMPEPVAE